MAFTGPEYIRGLLWTLLIFNLGFAPTVLFAGALVGMVVGGPSSVSGWEYESLGALAQAMLAMAIFTVPVSVAVGVTYGGAAAYGLGWVLRRERRLWVHRVLFMLLGGVVGALASAMFSAVSGVGFGDGVAIVPVAMVTAVSVWAGWEVTSRRALRGDASEGL